MDLLLTSVAVIAVVELAVHLLIGRPLRRLVAGLRRLEQGHVGPIEPGAGAWEIRWLAWRFERLGRELADNARRLVTAERRALDATRLITAREGGRRNSAGLEVPGPEAVTSRSTQATLARQYLQDTCRLLETLDAGEPVAHEIAEEAWTTAVVEAERLGDRDLKAQIEDAALRILEHRDFTELDTELAALRQRRRPWSKWVGERLSEMLRDAGVTALEIQHRVKHTAGVWRKMREAQLAVDQVHDLFAFRIIVPTELDCYLALAAVHRGFDPEPFRFKDYIESPKANGYRSLHTTVRDPEGRLFEVQIRTREMHDDAERGGAAHWRYRVGRWGSIASLRPRTGLIRRWIESRKLGLF
jgi:HAMP domain-containing protein